MLLVIFISLSSNLTIEAVQADKIEVANQGSNSISVINDTTNRVVATIPVGIHPGNMIIPENGAYIHVANQGSNTISVINETTNKVAATIPVGIHPVALESANYGYVYVANQGSNSISVINDTTNRVVATNL